MTTKTTRQPRKTTAKKTQTRKTTRRKAPAVDLRKPLPARATERGDFITRAMMRGAFTSTLAGLALPIRAWRTATGQIGYVAFRSGAHLVNNPADEPSLTAYTPCAQGGHHATPIETARDLAAAEHAARHCTADHIGKADWPDLIHIPRLFAALRATTSPAGIPELEPAHDPDTTQELDVSALLADTDAPKEHPEP